jgi:hypothetical protein
MQIDHSNIEVSDDIDFEIGRAQSSIYSTTITHSLVLSNSRSP